MPDDEKSSLWVEGIDSPPKVAPKVKSASPFESEFGPPLKRMPNVPDVTKQTRKRLSKG